MQTRYALDELQLAAEALNRAKDEEKVETVVYQKFGLPALILTGLMCIPMYMLAGRFWEVQLGIPVGDVFNPIVGIAALLLATGLTQSGIRFLEYLRNPLSRVPEQWRAEALRFMSMVMIGEWEEPLIELTLYLPEPNGEVVAKLMKAMLFERFAVMMNPENRKAYFLGRRAFIGTKFIQKPFFPLQVYEMKVGVGARTIYEASIHGFDLEKLVDWQTNLPPRG